MFIDTQADIRDSPKTTSIGIQCNMYLDQSMLLYTIAPCQQLDLQSDSGNDSNDCPYHKDVEYNPESEVEHFSDELSEAERYCQ